MKQKIFCVRDDKVAAYMRPFFVRSHGEAERMFMDTVNDPQSQFNSHPTDFSLWFLGEYDDELGQFDTVAPQHIINAVDVRRADSANVNIGGTE